MSRIGEVTAVVTKTFNGQYIEVRLELTDDQKRMVGSKKNAKIWIASLERQRIDPEKVPAGARILGYLNGAHNMSTIVSIDGVAPLISAEAAKPQKLIEGTVYSGHVTWLSADGKRGRIQVSGDVDKIIPFRTLQANPSIRVNTIAVDQQYSFKAGHDRSGSEMAILIAQER